MGIFKGETGNIHHLQVVLNEIDSKLKVMWWMDKLNDELIRQGQRNVPTFCDEEGNLAQSLQYQETFANFLTEIQQESGIILGDTNVG